MFRLLLYICIGILLNSQANALCVTSSTANLREGPSARHKKTWVVPKYTPLAEIQKLNGWYEVSDQDGERHWVSAKQVTKRMQCMSIKVDKAALRMGPGTSYPRGDIWYAGKYIPFKRLDIAENGWYQVESSWGKTYWLHPDLVWRPLKVMDVSY